MKNDKDIAKIKESFEGQTFSAPAFDFDQLDKTPIDKVVKESFEQVVVTAPTETWSKIHDGLTINKVWDSLAENIVVKSTSWRRYVATSAAVFILSLVPQLTLDNGHYSNRLSEDETVVLLASNNDLSSNVESQDESVVQQELLAAVSEVIVDDQSDIFTASDFISNEQIRPERQVQEIDFAEKLELTSIENIDFNPFFPLIPEVKIEDHKSEKKHTWSLGITAGSNRTWLRDAETRNALEKNTISSSKFSVGGSYGIVADVGFENNWGGQFSLVKGATRNRLGVYSNGYYNEKLSEINFLKLSVSSSYAYHFKLKGKAWILKSKLGATISHIGSSYASYNEVTTSIDDVISNHNFGVFTQIGPEFRYKNFAIETGINMEQGLLNIYDGNGQITPDMNHTSNREFGVFTSIRYIIK